MNTQQQIKTAFNKRLKAVENENEFIPSTGINNAHRKKFFTNFNEDLLKRILDIKTEPNG